MFISYFKTLAVSLKLASDFWENKMKGNKPARHKLYLPNTWQWEKHVKLFSTIPQSQQIKALTALNYTDEENVQGHVSDLKVFCSIFKLRTAFYK